MSVRETINQNAKITLAVVTIGVVTALGLAAYQGHKPSIIIPTSGYFSDDDGKTYFQDDASNIAPFDHQGKQAVSAYLFTGSDGKPFVGYLERALNAEARETVIAARRQLIEQASSRATPDSAVMEQIAKNLEVKRPGTDKWVRAASPEARSILVVTDSTGQPAAAVAP